mgnify:CR=1 FL=1
MAQNQAIYLINPRRGPESLWRGRSVLQTFHLPPAPDGRYALRLIADERHEDFLWDGWDDGTETICAIAAA